MPYSPAKLPGVRFLNHEAQSDAIRDSILRHRPSTVVIDDAGFDQERVRTLLELRRHGHRFRIVATTWPQHTPDVRRLLRSADVVELPLLERRLIDDVLKSLGATMVADARVYDLVLKRLMGHAVPGMTARYAHLTWEQLAGARDDIDRHVAARQGARFAR
jgi:DNA-binding NarL/FixJ family response regulator